jgi:SAM-dependent methyltransferase
MPNIASDPGVSDRPSGAVPAYQFTFSWQGPYGSAVHLVEEHGPPGIVLDLGCGYGAIGGVLADRGREYVGADVNDAAIADLRSRQLEGHVLDLTTSSRLAERLVGIADGRPIGAFLLLDVLEHVVDPLAVLEELGVIGSEAVAAGQASPVLVTSIPNVAHFDLGAKLVGGRWDITPTGLLDRTHLQMFTAARIQADFERVGWQECGQDDVILPHSDQSFPPDHPLLVEGGMVREYLWSLRSAADAYGLVNQFVRAYRFDRVAVPAGTEGELDGTPSVEAELDGTGLTEPFLTVLTRTQAERPDMLAEALACLAAQTVDSLEVIVLVHTDAADVVASVRTLVATFADEFASRVRVEQVAGGGRAAPLNTGLKLARGRYIACLDDDDLVTADWAESFQQCAEQGPGKVARSICLARHIRTSEPDEQGTRAHRVTLTRPLAEFADRFDALLHFRRNATPLMSFALPRALVSELNMTFDDDLIVCEDWDLLLRSALTVGVVDSGRVTSIYQRWDGEGTTTSHVSTEQWHAAHEQFLRGLDAKPLLLPPGSATGIAALIGGSGREGALEEEYRHLHHEFVTLEERARNAERERDEMRNSEFWRMTAPLRAMSHRFRSMFVGRPAGQDQRP